MDLMRRATLNMVRDYVHLFVNRRAYTMQSMRPHPETGRHYYFRPQRKLTHGPLLLTADTVRQHLEGSLTIGLYAISPKSQRCKWVAIDADYANAMEDLLKLEYHLEEDQVEPALEMSNRGGHLWIFLASPLLAKHCRIYIYNLAFELGVPVKGPGLPNGIEVFPKHDQIDAGSFGNAMRGPLGIHRGAWRRFWFLGANHTLEAQIAYLKRLRKLSEEQLNQFIAGKEMPQGIARHKANARVSHPARTRRCEFCILDYVGRVRKMGRNYVGRCPSCAERGRDRSGDNLAILIADPRFYQCWAGCTKEMVRAAVGWPIRTCESQGEDQTRPAS